MASTDPNLKSLILDIYDTALKPSSWPDVLDKISRYVGARGSFLFELQGHLGERTISSPYFSSGYDAELVESYLRRHNRQELIDQDIFARHSRSTDGIELIDDTVLAASETELLERENTRFMLQYGIRHRAGALLNKDQVDIDRFAMQFSLRHGPMSRGDRRKMATLLPHVAKALSINKPLSQTTQNYRSAISSLDLLRIGICILDRDGAIVHNNAEFDRQFDAYRVFTRDSRNRLLITQERSQKQLAHLMADVSHHGQFGAKPRKEAVIPAMNGEPFALCIEVCPLETADELQGSVLGGHLVYSLDTRNAFEIDGQRIARIFGLSDAETALIDFVTSGLTNAQISDRMGKSVETINSQVKSVLQKTQAANRTQLVRIATNICASNLLAR